MGSPLQGVVTAVASWQGLVRGPGRERDLVSSEATTAGEGTGKPPKHTARTTEATPGSSASGQATGRPPPAAPPLPGLSTLPSHCEPSSTGLHKGQSCRASSCHNTDQQTPRPRPPPGLGAEVRGKARPRHLSPGKLDPRTPKNPHALWLPFGEVTPGSARI